jgi:HEAT repeat protein
VPTDLAALLVEEGAVAGATMDLALARQAEAGGALDTALLELRAVDEAQLLAALSRATDLPPAPSGAWEAADARARRVFPSRVAERHGLAPFALDGRELSLVATYPVDLGLLDEISFMLSLHLTAHVGPEWRVRALIHRLYGGTLDPRFAALAEQHGSAAAATDQPEPAEQAAQAEPGGEPPEGDLSGEEPPAAAEEPPRPPPMVGFSRDDSEPLEPLAAALAQALESDDFPWLDDDAIDLGPPTPDATPATEATATAPEPDIDRSAPPHWTFEQARAALAVARSRDELVVVTLRYARDFFEFAALFAVTRDAVAGHDALGAEEGARDLCRATAIYTSDPGIFRTVVETRAPYLGPVAGELSGNEAILSGLGRGVPRTVLVSPVVLRDRTACILYADNGEAPVSARRLGDLLLYLAAVGPAFERLIRERKQRRDERLANGPPRRPEPPVPPAGEPPPQDPPEPEGEPGPAEPPRTEPGQPPAPPEPPDAWRTREPAAITPEFDIDVDEDDDAAGAASRSVEVELARLVGTSPGSPRRAQSVARLAAQGDSAVQALVSALPGPLEDDQALEPARLGPVPAALSLHGAAAVPLLLSVLQEGDPIRRRCAAVLLGAAAEPAAFGPLADRALDSDPRVAAAASEALARNRNHPGMRGVPDRLRRALLSGVTARVTGSARALGSLRDVEAIPLLVQVLETSTGVDAAAAAEALSRITLQRIGPEPRRWLAWWKENRGRGRAEWLFSGLTSNDREVRAAAAAELSEAAPSPVQYSPDAPPGERESAARAWAGWWSRSGRVL